MNRLSEFMRMSYAHLYGRKSIRTIEAYLDAVCKYIKYTGDPLPRTRSVGFDMGKTIKEEMIQVILLLK